VITSDASISARTSAECHVKTDDSRLSARNGNIVPVVFMLRLASDPISTVT